MSELRENETDFATEHQDSYLDMSVRREINEKYAEKPVDFNLEGLKGASEHVSLSRDDLILDVGSSSGGFVLKAAEAVSTEAYIIGLEPDARAQDYLPLSTDTSHFSFVQGFGEDIPLPDNSANVITAHNVLFRAHDMSRMLGEMKRVVEPEGLIVISTNSMWHAFWRHTFERVVARIVSEDLHEHTLPPSAPAEGCYLEQLPGILERAGGLQIIDRVTQLCAAVITRDRLQTYMYSIMLSINRTNLPKESGEKWRETVRDVVEPFASKKINDMEEVNRSKGQDTEAYFQDLIYRGMVIARNEKAA